jgi:hypothetical protein
MLIIIIYNYIPIVILVSVDLIVELYFENDIIIK